MMAAGTLGVRGGSLAKTSLTKTKKMRMRLTFPFAAAFAAFAVCAAIALALPAAGLVQAQNAAPAKKARVNRVRRQPPAERLIACTILGCHPIPPVCHPEMTFDAGGNPTGFEVAICPDDGR